MIQSVSDRGAAIDLKRARRAKASSNGHITLDRLPPFNLEMEQGVLGCQLLSPNECVGEVVKRNLTSEAFYDLRHQTIQDELLEMFNNRTPIDLMSISQRLKDKKVLEQCGGIGYMSQLQDAVPSAANLSYYLDIVQEKYLLRKMIGVCTEVVGRVYEYEGEVDSLLDEVERDVLSIRTKQTKETEDVKILVSESLHEISERIANKGKLGGYSTGFSDLDAITDGIHRKELYCICAAPSFGKSALVMNIVDNICVEQSVPVGIFTLEMTAKGMVKRMIASRARVDLRNSYRFGTSEEEHQRIKEASLRISKAPIHFDDDRDASVYQMRAKARRMVQEFGVKVFIFDYWQKMNAIGGARKVENRAQELTDIANEVFALGGELDTATFLLSQINDDEKLAGSRSLGWFGDNIWRIKKIKDGKTKECQPCILEIAKQKNGEAGVGIKLNFFKSFTKFESAAKIKEEDIPNEN